MLHHLLLWLALAAAGQVVPPAQAADPAPSTEPLPADEPAARTRIEVYTHPACPHCAAAKRWLADYARTRDDLELVYYDVAEDPEALARLEALFAEGEVAQPGVPAFRIGDTQLVGFDGPGGTGARIEALIASPRGGAPVEDACTPADPCREETGTWRVLDLPGLGPVDPDALGLPLFTVIIGVLDGFNPCATWVLLFVLSLLVNLRDRARMLAIGGTFVLVSGLCYLAFMEAWLSFYMLVGVSRTVQVVLAIVALLVGGVHVKDFFAFKRGLSLSIPDAAKPRIVRGARAIVKAERLPAAIGAALVLAVFVNIVELLCTAGLPAVYTEVLSSHGLPRWQHHGWLVVYVLVYMLDDALLLAVATITLSGRKLQERGGRWLKLVSGLVMLVLGLLLLAWPEALRW